MIRITDSHVMFAVRNHQHGPYIARIKRVLHDQLASSDMFGFRFEGEN